METVTIKDKNYKVSVHAQQRIAQRFATINLQEAIARSKFVDDNNVCKFGKAMHKKLYTMKQLYSESARLVINQYYNLAAAIDIKTGVLITVMYADGTWSDC
jgi:L-arabinose isomerase